MIETAQDLVGELEDAVRVHLLSAMPPDPSGELAGMALGRLLVRWFNWQGRFMPIRPRVVHRSVELGSSPSRSRPAKT